MKKCFSIIIFNIMILFFVCNSYGEGLYSDSGISFRTQDGVILREDPQPGQIIRATARVKNSSDSTKEAVLYLCRYLGNKLDGISVSKEQISAGGTTETFIDTSIAAVSGATYRAYIWNGSIGKDGVCSQETKPFDDSLDLNGITVGGKPIEGYKDTENSYTVAIEDSSEQIVLYPKSGAVKIDAEYNIPGISVIKLSAAGKERTITITTRLKQELSLSSLKYSYWDAEANQTVEKALEGFNSDTMEYTVTLPDNTFYARVTGESKGTMTYKVQDVDWYPNRVAGVSFGKIRQDTTGPTYSYPRLAIDRVIPIKNEETKAIIEVTDGVDTKEYIITFKAKQPRLTSYKLSKGAAGDEFVPVYTAGAGLNNDNGSVITSDRMWTAANISNRLIGASYFMSPFTNKNRNWWHNEGKVGDEYFRFSADTPGTLVAICGNHFSMEEYAETEGWQEGAGSGTKPPKSVLKQERTDIVVQNKALNNYDSPEYFFYSMNWQDKTDALRANLGVDEITDSEMQKKLKDKNTVDDTYAYATAWYRHFDSGDEVVIRKIDAKNSNGDVTEPVYIWAIIWDDIDVHYPTDEIAAEKAAEAELEPEPEPVAPSDPENLIASYDYLNNEKNGYCNEFSTVWKDLTKNSRDLQLDEIKSNGAGWGLNGFSIKAPEYRFKFTDDVVNKLNSGIFTIEFEADSIKDNAAIITSENEAFSICAKDGNVQVYCGSIIRNPISRPISDVISGVNRIVVSYDKQKASVDFKWYIDGEKLVEKKFVKFVFKEMDRLYLGSKTDKFYFGTNDKFYDGSACIKKLKIYDTAMIIQDESEE